MYTSYFAKLKMIPKTIIPISICGKAPDWYNGLQYKKLAPKYGFFKEWKQNKNNEFYIKHFKEEILDHLNVQDVLNELYDLANIKNCEKEIVLVCYEKPSDFCHRHLVAEWFQKNTITCNEWTDDDWNKEQYKFYISNPL